ncbi:MAG: diaminopimelate epimerase, partial [Flavobacteriaceae bacterium]|nr:diaminopimelate epimerase [Flavobacteriaceae bacterium]
QTISVRTYERGVEDETLSCGTGVVAAVLCMHHADKLASNDVEVKTIGGALRVRFEKTPAGYREVWLSGPASFVFDGSIHL